jgi:pSer/pThr/pTyr-binding forkhead associated (FHA) protein
VPADPDDSSLAASLLLPPVGIRWRDLVGVLRSIPQDSFLAVKPSPFFLQLLPGESADLPMLSQNVGERRTFVEERLELLAQRPLGDAVVHYLVPKGPRGQVKVGRRSGADVLIQDGTVSKEHALLQPAPRAWRLTDLGAANGTFIENRRLPSGSTLPVTSGMVVGFSKYRALFLAPEDIYQVFPRGESLPVSVQEVLTPVREGRPLRDVVKALSEVDPTKVVSGAGFLVQVPIEAEGSVLSDSLDAPHEMTQDITVSRIMRLTRSKKVGDARVHVVARSKRGQTVGRATSADLTLADSSVSREHVQIVFNKVWGLIDLGTRNGTYLEKERIPPGLRYDLRPGQGIFLSGYRALFLDLPHLMKLVGKVKGVI